MSTHGHPRDDPKGPVTCFLPNCAFFVQPQCPTCRCKQKEVVQIKATTTALLTTDDKEGTISTSTTVHTLDENANATGNLHRLTEPQVISVGLGRKIEPPVVRPNRSLFEVDSGTAWLECDECKSSFQVYINATFSTVAAVPLPNPVYPTE